MPPKINPNEVQWDSAPAQAIDPAQVQWDAPASPNPSMGDVALNAIPKGVANLVNTPVALFNLGKAGLEKIPGVKPSPDIENYPMKAMEYLGLVDPKKNPQTAAQRVIDTMIQSGIGMVGGPGGVVKNALTGVVAGGAGQATKELTGSDAAGAAISLATPFLLRSTARPEKAMQESGTNAIAKEARDLGMVIPRSATNTSALNDFLESVAGKAAIKQESILRNKKVINQLAAKDTDLAANLPLSETNLKGLMAEAGKPYDQFSKINNSLLEGWKQTNSDLGKVRRDQFTQPYDAGRRAVIQNLENQSNTLHQQMIREAQKAGNPNLIQDIDAARVKLGKLHDIEEAATPGGNINPAVIGQLRREKKLTGNLETIGKIQQEFPDFMGRAVNIPAPGVNQLQPYLGLGMGMAGSQATPAGWLSAGVPFIGKPMRSMLLSPAYQRYFATPDYGGLTPRDKLIEGLLATRGYVGAQ